MPLSREEFAALRRLGMSVEEIIAADTSAAGPPAGRQVSGSDPLGTLTGMASSAVEALGGPRALLIGGGGLAGLGTLRHVLTKRSPAPVPSTPAAGGARPTASSSALVQLTEADIAQYHEFRNFQPGQEIRRASYEKVKMGKSVV